jgi:hypothetical protein
VGRPYSSVRFYSRNLFGVLIPLRGRGVGVGRPYSPLLFIAAIYSASLFPSVGGAQAVGRPYSPLIFMDASGGATLLYHTIPRFSRTTAIYFYNSQSAFIAAILRDYLIPLRGRGESDGASLFLSRFKGRNRRGGFFLRFIFRFSLFLIFPRLSIPFRPFRRIFSPRILSARPSVL